MSIQRRRFIAIAAGGVALAAAARAQAPAQGAVDEKEPQAAALGYVTDASRADAKRFPKYAPGQACANCSLYQGKPTDPMGGCAIFGGRKVYAKAWCSAWVKKA